MPNAGNGHGGNGARGRTGDCGYGDAALYQRAADCTLDEVVQIQEEGRAKRRAAESELRGIENQLKEKLLNIRG